MSNEASERQRYEEAASWREAVLPRLQRAMHELIVAYNACPISMERIQIEKAMHATRQVLSICQTDLKLANQHLERMHDEIEKEHQ